MSDEPSRVPAPGRAWPVRLLFFAVALAVVVIDRIGKLLIQAHIPLDGQVQILPFLWLQNGLNSGAAFGIGRSATLLFALASIVVSVGLVVFALVARIRPWTALSLGLILGGAVGNGYDRVVYGAVTDFIALHWFPTFNLADAAVTLGVISLFAEYLVSSRREPAS